MTDAYLDELEALVAAATPGPWTSLQEGRDIDSADSFIQTGGEDLYLTGETVADADFIAEARTAVPTLVAELRRLRK